MIVHTSHRLQIPTSQQAQMVSYLCPFYILPLPYTMMNAMCMKIRWKLPSQTFGSVMIQMAISDLYLTSTFAWKFFLDHKLMFRRPNRFSALLAQMVSLKHFSHKNVCRRWNGTGLRRRLKKCPVMIGDALFAAGLENLAHWDISYIHQLVRWLRDTVTNPFWIEAYLLMTDWDPTVTVEGMRLSLVFLFCCPTFYDDTL